MKADVLMCPFSQVKIVMRTDIGMCPVCRFKHDFPTSESYGKKDLDWFKKRNMWKHYETIREED